MKKIKEFKIKVPKIIFLEKNIKNKYSNNSNNYPIGFIKE